MVAGTVVQMVDNNFVKIDGSGRVQVPLALQTIGGPSGRNVSYMSC